MNAPHIFTESEVKAAVDTAAVSWIVGVMVDAFDADSNRLDLPIDCHPFTKWGPDSDGDDGDGHNALKNIVTVPLPLLAAPPATLPNPSMEKVF
jgi:hypothetical protein